MASLLEEALPERAVREPETAGPDTRLLHGLVGEVRTDLVVTHYSDKLFIAVTQLGKLGTILEAGKEEAREGPEGAGRGRPVFGVSVLLGREREEDRLLARMLAERLPLGGRSLVLCVGIKDLTPNKVTKLVEFIMAKL